MTTTKGEPAVTQDAPIDELAVLRERLVRYAFVLTREGDTAHDLVQAVLERMTSRGLSSFEDPYSYARRSVTNEFLNWKRRVHYQARLLSRLGERGVAEDPAPQVVERVAIWGALSALPRRQQVAVVLRYYEQLPDAEIAQHLSCAPATVRSLIARAAPRLRYALGDHRE